MPAQRGCNSALLAQRQIITLSDIIQAVHLDHQMMDALFRPLDQRQAMVP
jgi:hypothetical protein